MIRLRLPIFILVALACLAAASPTASAQVWKADPNDPDSLWISPVDWRGDTLFTMDVWSKTDDSLAAAQIVIGWSNPAMRLDSAKLNVGRWLVGGYLRWTQAEDPTGVSLLFLPSNKRLPPGDGPVARLFFGRDSAYIFDEDIIVDTAKIIPSPPLAAYQTVFSEFANDPFLPTTVDIGNVAFSPCICPAHGDVDPDGQPNSLDLSAMIDQLFAGAPLPIKDPDCPHQHRGDFNCDNNYDSLDLAALIDYLFAGQAGPCDPCIDL